MERTIIVTEDGFQLMIERNSGGSGSRRLEDKYGPYFKKSDGWTRDLLEEALRKLCA